MRNAIWYIPMYTGNEATISISLSNLFEFSLSVRLEFVRSSESIEKRGKKIKIPNTAAAGIERKLITVNVW